jgi:hypothetical protein
MKVLCRAAGWNAPSDEPDTVLGSGLADFVLRGPIDETGPLARVLAAAEQLLAEPDPATVKTVGLFFEDLQNACSLGLGDLPSVEKLLTPNCLMVWEAAAAYWQRVADDTPDRTKEAPDLDSIQNETLRWMLISSYRKLPDGSYVKLTDVLRWEQTR